MESVWGVDAQAAGWQVGSGGAALSSWWGTGMSFGRLSFLHVLLCLQLLPVSVTWAHSHTGPRPSVLSALLHCLTPWPLGYPGGLAPHQDARMTGYSVRDLLIARMLTRACWMWGRSQPPAEQMQCVGLRMAQGLIES